MKRVMLTICLMLVLLGGCAGPIQFKTQLDGGGVYNTNKEILAFFEPKLADSTIHIGMSQDELLMICGGPAARDRSAEGNIIRETWRYGNIAVRSYRYGYKVYLFTFENGLLTNWRG